MADEHIDLTRLLADRNPLADDYRQFRVDERLLFTGHSHQAWPDCARAGHLKAFDDAAEAVDEKWSRAHAKADIVRNEFAQRLSCRAEEITLGQNTHELLFRLLSALDTNRRPRLLTTDAEFHSARRQLDRLAEAGCELVKVKRLPDDPGLAALAANVDERTAAVVVSSVAFIDGRIWCDFAELAERCRALDCPLIVDAYHMLNVVPMDLSAMGLGDAYVLGGGYKYCQLGEGNCFLRRPPQCDLRPVYTGWFAEFGDLQAPSSGGVAYGHGPWRFAGSTYDPTSHYRAVEVFAHFSRRGLQPQLLRQLSQAHVGQILRRFAAADLEPNKVKAPGLEALPHLAGFVVFELSTAQRAQAVVDACRAEGLWLDSRGACVRMGPAPYHSPSQIDRAMDILLDRV